MHCQRHRPELDDFAVPLQHHHVCLALHCLQFVDGLIVVADKLLEIAFEGILLDCCLLQSASRLRSLFCNTENLLQDTLSTLWVSPTGRDFGVGIDFCFKGTMGSYFSINLNTVSGIVVWTDGKRWFGSRFNSVLPGYRGVVRYSIAQIA